MLLRRPVSVCRCRSFATKPYEVFDRAVKLKQRRRAALNPESQQVEYLRDEVARRTIERLAFIKRNFGRVLDFGSGSGNFEDQLVSGDHEDRAIVREKMGNAQFVMADSCKEMLYRWKDRPFNKELRVQRIVLDEELGGRGSFEEGDALFDAVISNMSLHWVNDLPSVLVGLNKLLKKDGLFLASMISEDSLYELRTSLQLAESERMGGISPRVSPLVKSTDMSGLLKQSKFNLITIDVDEIVVDYPDLGTILTDLQLMGEQNSIARAPGPLYKDLLLATQAIYKTFHGNPDGSLPLTFRVLFMIGWKESENQPKPLERGSAEFDLKNELGS